MNDAHSTEARLRAGLAALATEAPDAEAIKRVALAARAGDRSVGRRSETGAGAARRRALAGGVALALAAAVVPAAILGGQIVAGPILADQETRGPVSGGAVSVPAPSGPPATEAPLRSFIASDRTGLGVPASYLHEISGANQPLINCINGRKSVTPLEPIQAGQCAATGTFEHISLETLTGPDLAGYTERTVEGQPVYVNGPVAEGDFAVAQVYTPLDESHWTIQVHDPAVAQAMIDSLEILPPSVEVGGVHGMDPADLRRERAAHRAGLS